MIYELARAWGLEPEFEDGLGRACRTSPESLCAVLAALGAPVASPDDAPAALAERRERQHPRSRVEVEWGAESPGYRWRRGEGNGRLTIRAPERAEPHDPRGWGVFLPLYAFSSDPLRGRPGEIASFSDLARLAVWAGEQGASRLGVLPLLAGFLVRDRLPFDASPYSPASRRFWNETYVDPVALAERCGLPMSGGGWEPDSESEPELGGEGPDLVDPGRAAARRRRRLEHVARRLFDDRAVGGAREGLEAYRREHPEVEDYAAFRAYGEARGDAWQTWPAAARDGVLRPDEIDEDRFRYHLVAQWAADEQLRTLRDEPRAAGLYLDLPLGSHASSYDVWRDRDLYGHGLSVGAPPDAFFTGGQDWGFPPLLPEPLLAAGLRPWIETLRHSLGAADTLRVDHVMQLERLYVIPHGAAADDGVYLRYPLEALGAVLVTESRRAGTPVVGEDLGTVSPEIRGFLDRRGLARSHVTIFEFDTGQDAGVGGMDAPPLRPVPPGALAAVGTHDTPTFHGFWAGADLDLRRELGLFADPADLGAERVGRERLRTRLRAWAGDDPAAVLDRLHETLAASPAALVMVQLEDLLGETEPQNVPGTGPERPNWRRRTRRTFEDWSTDPALLERLARLDALRRDEAEEGEG